MSGPGWVASTLIVAVSAPKETAQVSTASADTQHVIFIICYRVEAGVFVVKPRAASALVLHRTTRFRFANFYAPTVKIIQQIKGFGIVFFQSCRTVLRFWPGHVQI